MMEFLGRTRMRGLLEISGGIQVGHLIPQRADEVDGAGPHGMTVVTPEAGESPDGE
jgi:hypothetical protein